MYNSTFMSKKLFNPESDDPFKLSRTKIEEFIECPRCFYLNVRLGISHPSLPAFSLNSAVDTLLKKEFDIHRANGEQHPLMKTYGIDAVPYDNGKLKEWRNKGISFHHKETNFVVFGKVDDVWIGKSGEIFIVDYKATSTSQAITLDGDQKDRIKREVEVYQWLFRKNGFLVSDIAYFVFCNANRDRKAFDGKLEFDVKILPYKGNDDWVEEKLKEMKECLMKDTIPSPSPNCEYCRYIERSWEVLRS